MKCFEAKLGEFWVEKTFYPMQYISIFLSIQKNVFFYE